MSPIAILFQALLGTVPVVVLGVPFIFIYFHNGQGRLTVELICCFVYVVLVTVSFSILGSIFYNTKNVQISYAMMPFLLTEILIVLYEFVRLKNQRLIIISLGGLFIVFSFLVYFVASMSIANDWL
jgi:hypothetical protein